MKKVLIIGAGGFIGSYLKSHLKDVYVMESSLRNLTPDKLDFSAIDSIIYCTGIAHQTKKTPEQLYFKVNTEYAYQTAQSGKKAGVKQFIYLSTIKVYGESSVSGESFNEKSSLNPCDAYARSKVEAEKLLMSLADRNYSISLLRLPMVYGPNPKGNFSSLIKIISLGIPLPFKNVFNKRSILYLGNLNAFLQSLFKTPETTGIFLVSDPEPISTEELVQHIAKSLRKKIKLLPLPGILKNILSGISPGLHQRLFGSFVIDSSESNKKILFIPPFSTFMGIQKAIEENQND